MDNHQYKAYELNEAEKREAEDIARKLFGKYNWEGFQQRVYGKAGMSEYINRSVMRRIRPKGARWLVTEKRLSWTESVYYHKQI